MRWALCSSSAQPTPSSARPNTLDAGFPSSFVSRLEYLVGRNVHALEHGGQHISGLEVVLVFVHTDGEFVVVRRRLQHPQSGAACRGINDVRAIVVQAPWFCSGNPESEESAANAAESRPFPDGTLRRESLNGMPPMSNGKSGSTPHNDHHRSQRTWPETVSDHQGRHQGNPPRAGEKSCSNLQLCCKSWRTDD